MPGKKKKREKHSGLSLSRIGAALVPGAIFAAVPSTAQSFSETWPRRKKNLSALSTALGSVGNLAQAIVIADSITEEHSEKACTSNETLDNYEDYESEGHYEIVDETIINGHKDEERAETIDNPDGPPVQPIYATVNKKKKQQPQEEELNESSSSAGSEDDITSVSGMGSEEEDSSTAVNRHPPATRKRSSKKRRSGKDKLKMHSPRNIPEEIKEEPVTKTDVNDNMILASADFGEDFMEDAYSPTLEQDLQNEFLQTTEATQDSKTQTYGDERNFNIPTEFEREQFNESNLYASSEGGSPRLSSRRDNIPLGASASDLATHSPDVPPIGERETPIGKGRSTESISSAKERWHNLAQSSKREHESMIRTAIKNHALDEDFQEEQRPKQQEEKQLQKKKKKARKEEQSEELHLPEQEHILAKQQEKKRFSQSAQLVRQQIEVANKLRALSARGSYAVEDAGNSGDADITRENSYPSESITKNAKERITDNLPGEQGEDSKTHDERTSSKRRKKKSKIRDEHPPSEAANYEEAGPTSQSAALQQMSTSIAKEACRKLYRQVKTLDREKAALESLSQSLNEENTSLKKLNESLTKNMDTSGSAGVSIGLLQMQIEQVNAENIFLKDSVHRLNVELARYQAKYRTLSPQEVDQMFKNDKNHPPWLVNKKYIAPLLLAYDDRIKEKQVMIQTYEEQLKRFKDDLQKIMEENVHLQKKLSNSEAIMHNEEEWRQLEKQATLVLSENEVLMERQELHNKKLAELTAFYKGEVSRLSQQYEKAEVEKGGLQSKLEVLNTTLNGYKQELETSSSQWTKHVSVEEHLETVNDCRRKLEELRKKTQEQIDSLTFQLEASRDENKSLTIQLAEFKLANAQLEREVHNFTEVQRKNERKALILKEKLNHIQQREATAQDTLSEVLKVAEKTTLERDTLNEMLKSKQLENKKVHSLVKLEEDKLKECQNKASLKITAIKGRVKEQERATEVLKDRYENEIKNLKSLIRRQQRQMEDMVNDKRNLENELSAIYETIADNDDNIKNIT